MTASLQQNHPEFRPNVIINATGLLHDVDGESPLRPETTFKQLSAETFKRSFDVNVLGNFLAVRYFLGELADKKSDQGVFAALSARVGSISDNTAGGWYSYRCGKVSNCLSLFPNITAICLRHTSDVYKFIFTGSGQSVGERCEHRVWSNAPQLEVCVNTPRLHIFKASNSVSL